MKVILRDNLVVSLNAPTLPLILPGEEVVDAPRVVNVGWYRDGDTWIPPKTLQERSKML